MVEFPVQKQAVSNPSLHYLTYPSLDLFLYQLRDGVGEDEKKLKENHTAFWANLPPELKVDLEKESEAENPDYTKLLELTLGKSISPLQTEPINGYPIGGYYYPVRLGDTYGLLFNCCVEDKVHYQNIRCLQDLKVLANGKTSNLGKTWIISGWLPSGLAADPKAVAHAAYKIVMGREWEGVKEGKFLGADIFEVWPSSQHWKSLEASQDSQDNNPVLLIIYPNREKMEECAKYYPDWLHLFCYRNKILWYYRESRKYTQWLQKKLASINDTIQALNDSKSDLQTAKAILEKNLAIHSNYLIQLGQLEILSQTITVNLENYQKWLNRITLRSNQVGETNLEFLKEFIFIAKQQYQEQIKQDYVTFKPGLSVLEHLVNTIRGIMEINQVELRIEQGERDRRLEIRDRNFQTGVAAVGAGIGVASIAASAISPFVEKIVQPQPTKSAPPPPPKPWLNFWLVFGFSMGWGLLTSGIVLAVVWLQRRLFSRTR